MPETTPLIKAALNLRVGAGFDVYSHSQVYNNFYQNVKQDDVVGRSVKYIKISGISNTF